MAEKYQLLTFDEWAKLSPESRARINRYVQDAERVARRLILNLNNGATEADVEAAARIVAAKVDRGIPDSEN